MMTACVQVFGRLSCETIPRSNSRRPRSAYRLRPGQRFSAVRRNPRRRHRSGNLFQRSLADTARHAPI